MNEDGLWQQIHRRKYLKREDFVTNGKKARVQDSHFGRDSWMLKISFCQKVGLSSNVETKLDW
jgi:hypothetical protein